MSIEFKDLPELTSFISSLNSEIFCALFMGLIAGALLVCAGVMIERNRK